MAQYKKILIFRYDRIGDMLLTTPVFDILHRNAPQAEIHVLASESNDCVIRCDKRVAKVFLFKKNVVRLLQLRRQIRQENYNCVLCLVFDKTKDGLLAQFLCGTRAVRVTVAHERRFEVYTPLYDVQVPRVRGTIGQLQAHVVCHAFGWQCDLDNLKYELAICNDSEQRMETWFRETVGEYAALLLNLSAGDEHRSWTPQSAAEVAKFITVRYPQTRIIALAMPAEAAKIQALRSACPEILAAPPTPDIMDVISLVRRAVAVITPDTSVLHIAAIEGKPLVGLYSGISFEELFAPVHNLHEILRSEADSPVSAIKSKSIIEACERLFVRTSLEKRLC